ncbi:MAG: alpha/beta hydrolase [Steroidobacteraceae bacterium]|nr:alpha/beta hydrolase [Steroidobacteraceae bacterium]
MASIWNELQGVEFRQTYYDAGGVRTRVIEAGQGTPLVFLHGTGGHAEAYLRNIEAHARHFHVYAIDMIGHGYTSAPDISYEMQCYVDFLRSFLDAIGADSVMISGESLGASVASWFAIAEPARVLKIVLNTGILLTPSEQGASELRDLLNRSRAAAGAPTREAIRKRMRWLVREEESLTDELIEARLRIYSQPGRAAIIGRIAEQSIGALLEPESTNRWYGRHLLERIRCPTLVLWTRYNPGQSADEAAEGARLIPDCSLVVLENSAHWPQWEEPEAFNRAHLDFLLA